MNIIKQKQRYRYREQGGGCRREGVEERNEIGERDEE